MGWECRIPLSSWLVGLGEHLKLPQQGPKQSPEKRLYCFLSVSERFSLEYICISTQSHLFSRTLHVTFQDFPGPRPDFRTFQVIESLTFWLQDLSEPRQAHVHKPTQLTEWDARQVKGKPYSTAKCRVPELILVLGSQPAGDVSHKPGVRLPLLSSRPKVILATLKRAATNFAAWWKEAQWVWIVWQRLLPNSVAAAIWTWPLLCLSPAH